MNQGITHLRTKTGIACNDRRGHMAVPSEQFANEPRQCAKCAKTFARWQELKQKAGAR